MTPTTALKYDIFISYGQVDDQPTSAMEQGWVSTLVKDLKVLLDQHCGRVGACRVWWDQGSLPHHGNITSNIKQALQDTGILLVIYSQGYLSSDWCTEERGHFLTLTGNNDPERKRIFLVEKDRVDLEQRPLHFGDMFSHKFWESKENSCRTLGIPSTKGDNAYFTALDRLARELYEQIKQQLDSAENTLLSEDTLSLSATTTQSGNETTKNFNTVFLAQVTEDLDSQRDQVKDYLSQAGLRVIPERLYPTNGKGFAEALENDLEDCSLFAQLLGPQPGRKLEGLDLSYVTLQHQTAQFSNKPILQWRPKTLKPQTVTSPEHRQLLELETVMAVDLNEFKQAIVQRLEQQRKQYEARKAVSNDTTTLTNAFVFLSNTRTDQAQAERIGEILSQRGYSFASTLIKGNPEELKEELEANLMECDGLIVVHGNSTPAEMRRLLRNCRTWISRREHPPRALALYQGPPPDTKGNVGMLGKMQTIDCCGGLDENKIIAFLDTLNNGG